MEGFLLLQGTGVIITIYCPFCYALEESVFSLIRTSMAIVWIKFQVVYQRISSSVIPASTGVSWLFSAFGGKGALSLQVSPTLCDPVDCSPPGSSVHGTSPAKILEWVAISFSKGSSRPRDQICVSCIGRWILYHCATLWESSGLLRHGSYAICNDFVS